MSSTPQSQDKYTVRLPGAHFMAAVMRARQGRASKAHTTPTVDEEMLRRHMGRMQKLHKNHPELFDELFDAVVRQYSAYEEALREAAALHQKIVAAALEQTSNES